jgi:serine O-acetyltransferase
MLVIYGSRIGSSCVVGRGTQLAYKGMGVLIVSGTKIGERCMIGAGCKIIRKFPYRNVPVLDDNIYIGPNAVICGPVHVESDAIIAPNAVVVNSVRRGCIVGGIPARVIGHVDLLDYDISTNPQFKEGWAAFLEMPDRVASSLSKGADGR